MKKILLTIVIVLLIVSPLSARIRTRSFDLQGAYGEVAEIAIEPVPAQSQAYIQGMPFNIEDSLVQYVAPSDGGADNPSEGEANQDQNQQNGRYIADFSLISNTDFNVYIRADRLKSVEPKSDGNPAELDYVLTFDYRLAYYTSEASGTEPSEISGRFKYETSANTANGANCYWRMYDIFTANSFYGLVGALNGPVYFQFTQAATNTINNAKALGIDGYKVLPSGDYTADVYVVLEAV